MSSVTFGEDCPEGRTEPLSQPFTPWPPLSFWLHHLIFFSLPPLPMPPHDIIVLLTLNFQLLEHALCFHVCSPQQNLPAGGPNLP